MKLGGNSKLEIESISSGSLGLDIALGVGGLPRGRVVEIYGPESSGKTTLALHVVAEAQRGGGVAAFIDAEHALDPAYARKLGVNLDNLLVSQPDTGEQALEITDTLVRSGAVDVIVIDSVAALTPKAEIEGEMGDALPGLQARLMSQALRKLTGSISKSKCIIIFINQIRMKIGVMYGSPETTTGGNALKFYASAALARSRARTRRSATMSASRWSRTRWRPRSARSSSTSCTGRGSPRSARLSTSASRLAWWKSRAPGSPSIASALAKVARTFGSS
jgi:recombination protein RecA